MSIQPPQQPPPKVPTVAVLRAVDALLKHKSQESASKNPQLLPSDEFLYLILTLTKIPQKSRVNAFKIPLPNSLYSPENSEICLFVNDANSKIAKSKVEEEKLPIAKVIKLTKLKKEYKAYELKRKLCDSYDLFMAEKRIIPLLPNAIGKGFYKKKKIPVPIEMSRGNWKDQIDKICSSALLYLSTGSCSVIKVARVSMERDEIVANVAAAIEGIANVVPKKWGNVRSFHLKLAESVALPVYQKVPELGFKIGGAIGDSEEKEKTVVVTVKKGEGLVKSKKTAKGRIHEVKYMDEVMIGEEEVDSEGEEVVDEEEKAVNVGNKRKKSGGEEEKKVKKGEKSLKKKKTDLSGKKSKKSKV
ncbi:uncharacterized protein LOC141596325 [Silene latifolia]|uniref:uncharacterized protein LOC141596325 n=1 Tax=Silene latifolia TaxID=37657 RepID=UPI003D771694